MSAEWCMVLDEFSFPLPGLISIGVGCLKVESRVLQRGGVEVGRIVHGFSRVFRFLLWNFVSVV